MSTVVASQATRMVNWPAVARAVATAPIPATHVLDFGPGGTGGTAGLTARATHGQGVQVILAATTSVFTSTPATAAGPQASASSDGAPRVMDMTSLLVTSRDEVPVAANWRAAFGPTLLSTAEQAAPALSTKLSRLIGRPPVIVAGMTPTTSCYGLELVAAVVNAGYHGTCRLCW